MEDKNKIEHGSIVKFKNDGNIYRYYGSYISQIVQHPSQIEGRVKYSSSEFSLNDLEYFEDKLLFEIDMKIFNSMKMVKDWLVDRKFADFGDPVYSCLDLELTQSEYKELIGKITETGNKIIGITIKQITNQ